MSDAAQALGESEIAAVRQAWDGLISANLAGDWGGTQTHLTHDYVQLDPRVDGLLQGSDRWREWVESLDFQDLDGRFDVQEISGCGHFAYILWTFAGSWTEEGEHIETSGKGLAVFRKEADGTWRMSRNGWTGDP